MNRAPSLLFLHFLFLHLLLVAARPDPVGVDDGKDYIVIHAAEEDEYRSGRQNSLWKEGSDPEANKGNSSCITKNGRHGQCKSLKACYPYFKLFNLDQDDTWIMGSYDTCSYSVPEGKKLTGVCCADPKSKHELEEEEKQQQADDAAHAAEGSLGGFPIEFSVLNQNCGGTGIDVGKDGSMAPQVTDADAAAAEAIYFKSGVNNAPTFKVVNGEVSAVNEFPFMAAMTNNNRQFCGGSLIDDIHILTAAHCVAHMSKHDIQKLRVLLGDHNLKETGETKAPVVEYSVKTVIRHKHFNKDTLHNDVAILTLNRAAETGPTVQPICLSTNDGERFTDQVVEVAGWGVTSAGAQKSSEVLRKVDVKVWSNEDCAKTYGSDAPGGITASMLCASIPDQRKDSCSGDSGGPLFTCGGGHCRQMGVVSWGIGCAEPEHPGVYTRVTSFLPWISNVIKDH